ncbi:phosphatase domain-containing protein [Luteococcus japonicus]|uniref:Conserved protein with diacylglycerol kinase catalytic domain n=1 Tax=Luteococcus japonicus LSP_Lj1 TaxID=1255658 RepID=A0A1R4K1I6_9ACTN|nr:phosphatase domain-containing protein [Luteococcus japonicus]SJN38119.1 conserved protein with diacylglycerol kinase catalytic domain [Luteococcus japonicus LSP_Lj1]
MSAELGLVRELLAHSTGEDEEGRLLALLRALDTEELNELLDDHTADRLLGALDNHLLGSRNRDAVIDLVAVQRAGELDLHSRAAVIYGLQTGRTGHRGEEAIAGLVCAVEGAELTHLKNIVNLRSDHHDLEGLVFKDLDDRDIRQRVLDHIHAQAQGMPVTEAKVLSDIDDTVFCKLHDHRYPRGTLYPGVLAFQEALDMGPDDDPLSIGDLTFVTARPMDFFGLVENHSRESLKKAGVADLSVMSGSPFSLLSLDTMAGKKLENIAHHVQLYPEYRMTFMGDSGQGDVQVGERLWQEFPEAMDAVFIHDVVDTGIQARREHAEHRVWFHDTYVGAAAKALELGLISRTRWKHVVDEAAQALEEIVWDSGEQEAAMRVLFERDLADGAGMAS